MANNSFKSLQFASLIAVCLLIYTPVSSQKLSNYYLELTDKNGSPYSLDRPLEFLSQRCLDRMARNNVSLDYSSLPVSENYLADIRISNAKVLFYSRWQNSVTISSTDSNWLVNNPKTYIKSTLRLRVIDKRGKNDSFKKEPVIRYYPDYGEAYNQVQIHHGGYIHSLGFQGQGKLVAVIDGGFQFVDQSPALKHLFLTKKLIGVRDIWSTNSDTLYKLNNHGAYVLGTMAGILPKKYLGSAVDAEYLIIRSERTDFERKIEEAAWISAIEYADSMGADLVNSSLGYTEFDDSFENYTFSDLNSYTSISSRQASMMLNHGMLLVNSAGNSGRSSFKYIGAPADATGILSVGSINLNTLLRTGFSSFGFVRNGIVKPEVMSMGAGTAMPALNSDQVVYNSGTSFSSPLLAGLITSLWSAFPNQSAANIRDAIIKSSDRYISPNEQYGYGIPDMIIAYNILKTNVPFDINDIQLKLFPIPTNSLLNITGYLRESDQWYTINIHNSQGKLLYTYYQTMLDRKIVHKVDVSAFYQGTYIVSITTNSQHQSQRFLVN